MSPEIIASLIAVAGVVASVAASMLLARHASRDEIRRLRDLHATAYATRLLEARLAAYPRLYAVLSAFIKHLEGGSPKYLAGQPITVADVRELLADLVAWDTENAILLSDRASQANFTLRQFVISLVVQLEAQSQNALTDFDVLSDLLLNAGQVEIALKVDLGVYDVEKYEARDYYATYFEVAEKLAAPDSKPP